MGHITRIKINHQSGHVAQVSEIEGSIDSSELMGVLNAVTNRNPEQVPSLEEWQETAQVPRSSMDGESDAESWRKRFELSEAMHNGALESLDSARGAVRILGKAVGIESGNDCNVAKLAKQVHGRVQSMSSQYYAMVAELENLRGAMTRMQMPDVPECEEDMELPKQCQALAHHMDVLKRTGFSVVPEEAKPGVHVHAPQTREERFERLKLAQQEATRMMIDLATIDGYVTKDTPADEVMAKTMAWSVRIDQERRLEEEGVKKGAPTTGDPKVGVATVTQNHQPGLDVKVAFSPDAAGGEGVAKSVEELIGLKMKDAIESASTGPFENDDEKAELEGSGSGIDVE